MIRLYNKFKSMNNPQPSIGAHRDPGSTTHSKYSFSKTPRFPSANAICPEAFYNCDSQLSKRKAGFGYGKKVEFTSFLPNTPASNRYRINSCFQETKGSCFGTAREKSPDRSYLVPQIHKHPGVGKYQNQVRTRMPQEYSLHCKTIDVIEKGKMKHYTPGPGSYESNDFENGAGKHSNSKYTDSKYGTIEPSRRRFPVIRQSPGPSTYDNEDGSPDSNRFTLSGHTAKGGRVFNREARFTGQQWRPSDTPSPANYEVPIEFGRPEELLKTTSNFHNN